MKDRPLKPEASVISLSDFHSSTRSLVRDVQAAAAVPGRVTELLLRADRLAEQYGGQVDTDRLLGVWQAIAFEALDRVHGALTEPLKKGEAQPSAHSVTQLATLAGIATDKTLLLAGRPTIISAELHANMDLPELADKLSRVAKRLRPVAKPLPPDSTA